MFKAIINPKCVGDKKAFSNGYIYAFKAKNFKKLKNIPHEFYCKSNLEYDFVIEVKPNEFLKRHSFMYWRKEELIESKKFSQREIEIMGY